MFRHFQYKVIFAMFVAGVAITFQNIELDPSDKNKIAEKAVVLPKSQKEVYQFMTRLENLPLVFHFNFINR